MRIFAVAIVAVAALAAPCDAGEPVRNRAPLTPSAFDPLPLNSVKPRGWLLEQLRIQAAGLTGHIDEFWPDLGPSSAWLGGSGEGWERGPYYLDGLVPLAYLLEDAKLIGKAKPWIEWTLTHQRPDGSIGPEKNNDWWPLMIMLKVLTQYQEATGDSRVIPLMEKYFLHQLEQIDQRPLYQWAIYRWQDEVLSILWLYNRTGNPKLLDLARKLQRQGHNWRSQFENFLFTGKVDRSQQMLATHGVNNAMGLKTSAVWYLISRDGSDRKAANRMHEVLDRYHGLPIGIFSADEHYSGRNPSQGIELCAVVEAMFSLEHELAILGDAAFGDRLEKLAYNALPATMSADLWSHQYDQQPNQVACTLARRDWTSNGPESNLFGLEPNFGCCTANLHQGWPKFAASLWMLSPGDGLVATAYAPSRVSVKIRGVDVIIDEDTEYPFRDRVTLTVSPSAALRFPLLLRVPGWVKEPRISVNGQPLSGIAASSFHRIERDWRKGDKVEIVFPMPVIAVRGFNDSVHIERGPLLFALSIGESWRKLRQIGPAADWEVFPTSPWNYALKLDPENPTASIAVAEASPERQPFQANAPVLLKAKARRLPEWVMVNDSAAPPPASPVVSKRPEETITLVPYGGARLRITSFPVLAE